MYFKYGVLRWSYLVSIKRQDSDLCVVCTAVLMITLVHGCSAANVIQCSQTRFHLGISKVELEFKLELVTPRLWPDCGDE